MPSSVTLVHTLKNVCHMIHKYSRYIRGGIDSHVTCSLNKKISPTTLFLPVLINLRIEINIIQKGKRVGMKHNIPLKGALFYHVCVYFMPLSLAGKKEADILLTLLLVFHLLADRRS